MFLQHYFTRLYLLLVLPASLSAVSAPDVYIQGRIVSAEDSQPIDSVRVGSVLLGSTAISDRDGVFALSKSDVRWIPGKTHEFGSNRSIALPGTNRLIRLPLQSEENVSATVTDLFGRVVGETGHLNRPRVPAFSTPFTSGIYLLSVYGSSGYRGRWKLLIPGDRSHIGVSASVNIPATTGNRPGCSTASSLPDADTVFFCRDGYYSIAYPMSGSSGTALVTLQKKQWCAFDIHNHTWLTDGEQTLDRVLDSAFGVGGLDLLANSEHGSVSSLDTAGLNIYPDGSSVYQWRTLAGFSWPKVLGQRQRFPGKTILQGVEWNVPGHEHASVGFVDDSVQPEAVSDFNYLFDYENTDTTTRPDFQRYNEKIHGNAIAGLEWLQRNFPKNSYCFPNHPGNNSIGTYVVNDFRDFHNTAPDICFGFEGMPGHQKYPFRGKYDYGAVAQFQTYGGADFVLAKLGGVWDALLGEGRRFWTIINSDFHTTSNDFWPGEYEKTWVAVADTGARAWLTGVRSGEMFIVHGDLIDALDFSIDDGIVRASMGADMRTGRHEFRLRIRFRSPDRNNNGDTPQVDHIDCITGAINDKIDPADTANYMSGVNPTTRVAYRFSASDWHAEAGWSVVDTAISIPQSAYFRLRGTNHPPGTPGELDDEGNPLVDEWGAYTAAIAWSDLWFYSNPIFVYVK